MFYESMIISFSPSHRWDGWVGKDELLLLSKAYMNYISHCRCCEGYWFGWHACTWPHR